MSCLPNRLVHRIIKSSISFHRGSNQPFRICASAVTQNSSPHRTFTRKMSAVSPPTYTSAPNHRGVHEPQETEARASQAHGTSNPNRLINEKSPYLLQHAYNPVDWYPWGTEAFNKAKAENKLIFLSVGYSTCHWCHVMERESFENPEIAQIMNEHFVNIKVDREERPDVDKMYMTFVQASAGRGGWPMSVFLTPGLEPVYGGTYYPPRDGFGRPGFPTLLKSLADQATSGSGGWPMSVWLTPDLKPVYGGTYFPNTDKYYGQPSFPSLLRSLAKQWKENPSKFLTSGNRILEVLKESAEISGAEGEYPGMLAVDKCYEQLQRSYEPKYGGFSRAPKFPQPVNMHFLFAMAAKEPQDSKKRQKALEMCFHTLRMMAQGGIHDHVSKGFARYSTDEQWHVPHFEKMLYDQGQLAVAYAEAYLLSKDKYFADIVDDILEYVSRDLCDSSGGFYSAEDADSFPYYGAPEKREGAFCVWTYREVQEHLSEKADVANTPKLSDVIATHFGVKPQGNVEPRQDPHGELKGQNVLIVRNSLEATAAKLGLSVERTQAAIVQGLKILHEARQLRPRPHLDDKMLTAWNGLMISGFAKGGGILGNSEYIKRAEKAARFIQRHLYLPETQTLLRSCYKGETTPSQIAKPIPGFLDDYAFIIRSLLDLFEVTQNMEWVQWAYQLQETQNRLFWDPADEGSGYFTSPEGDPSILVRLKEDQDGAEPSGNSVSVSNLLRLAAFLDEEDYRHKASKILQVFGERLAKVPVALPEMVAGLITFEESPTEVVVVGPREAEETQVLLRAAYLSPRLLTGRIILCLEGNEESSNLVLTKRPDLRQMKTVSNRATAYVCRHRSCSAPVTSPHDLINLLESH